jgi:hypothetical protein
VLVIELPSVIADGLAAVAYVLPCEPIDGVSARQVILVDRDAYELGANRTLLRCVNPRGQQVPLPRRRKVGFLR